MDTSGRSGEACAAVARPAARSRADPIAIILWFILILSFSVEKGIG
jgi:hypothetical protein